MFEFFKPSSRTMNFRLFIFFLCCVLSFSARAGVTLASNPGGGGAPPPATDIIVLDAKPSACGSMDWTFKQYSGQYTALNNEPIVLGGGEPLVFDDLQGEVNKTQNISNFAPNNVTIDFGQGMGSLGPFPYYEEQYDITDPLFEGGKINMSHSYTSPGVYTVTYTVSFYDLPLWSSSEGDVYVAPLSNKIYISDELFCSGGECFVNKNDLSEYFISYNLETGKVDDLVITKEIYVGTADNFQLVSNSIDEDIHVGNIVSVTLPAPYTEFMSQLTWLDVEGASYQGTSGNSAYFEVTGDGQISMSALYDGFGCNIIHKVLFAVIEDLCDGLTNVEINLSTELDPCKNIPFNLFLPGINSSHSVSWSVDGTEIGQGDQSSHTFSSLGTKTFIATVAQANCPNVTIEKEVTSRDCTPVDCFDPTGVSIQISQEQDLCEDQFFSFFLPGLSLNQSIKWSVDGQNISTANSGTHKFNLKGTKKLIATVTQSECPNVTVEKNIEVITCIDCEECIESFSPLVGKKYVLSMWLSEDGVASLTNYENVEVFVDFPVIGVSKGPFHSSGQIIDGWQRLEAAIDIPYNAKKIRIRVENKGTNGVYMDDIRFHPFNSNMKSYVYDPTNFRLMAELDENNYATFYEYDEEGALVRVKKETVRGVSSIQESRNNTKKLK